MPRLVVNPGSPTAWEIELKPGTNTLGRGFANDFKITDPSVSGSHCQIMVEDGNVIIKDLGSTNGTYVNRAPVSEAALQPGQTVHLGGVEMTFEPGAQPYVRITDSPATVQVAAPPPPVAPSLMAAPPPATITGTQQCKFHPKTVARYFCTKCSLPFCELCVTTRPLGGTPHKFCRRCGTECTPLKVQMQRAGTGQSFYGRLPGALVFPSRGSGVFVLLVCTIVMWGLDFISAGWLSIFAKMVFFGYMFSFMQNIIHSTAAGDEEMPGWPAFDDLFGCFLRFLAATMLSFGPYLILSWIPVIQQLLGAGSGGLGDRAEPWSAPPEVLMATLVLGCLYFPMALLAVAMKDSPLAANPLVVIPAIFKAPVEYIVTVLVLAGVMGIRKLGGPLIESIFPRGLTTHSMPKLFAYLGACGFWYFAGVYLLAVNMRILGLLYLSKKQKLAWFDH